MLEIDSVAAAPIRLSETRRFFKVFLSRGLVIFGMVVIIGFIFLAIVSPYIVPYNPDAPDLDARLENPSWQHWLGTDTIGRDTLSRIMIGSRTSLVIGLGAVTLAAVAGMGLGLVAGYFGGWIYAVIMRFIDALMAFPMILLALMMVALMGSSIINVIIALAVGGLAGYARLMAAQVLSIKENDYVLAAHSLGASNLRTMFRHVFPNTIPALIVLVTMALGGTILAEAGLSFLGLGIQEPTAAWGGMVNTGRQYLLNYPILSIAPGGAIMLVVFAFNMVGDGLRDALDPRLRGIL
jgi:peptide/nickel transport system permease protein